MTQQKEAELYQPLFDLMSKEHGLILLKSEMYEIIKTSKKVEQSITDYYNSDEHILLSKDAF